MKRELSDEAVKYQAEAFLSRYERQNSSLMFAFGEWAKTKDFNGPDLSAIRQVVLAMRKETA